VIDRRKLLKTSSAAALIGAANVIPARAETNKVRVSLQFGIGYLQLMVMREQNLIEKQAKAAGLGDIEVEWMRLSGTTTSQDALIANQLDFVGGGLTGLVVMWEKTRGNFGVRGVASLPTAPMVLMVRNPNVKTIRDFTEKDRIAMPQAKSGPQATMLQMAAEKEWGVGQHARLDNLTISRPHPDAMAAMLSGGTEITAHFTNHPFIVAEAKNPDIRPILNSTEFLGGPHTSAAIWSTSRFRESNPKTMAAFVAAMKEASDWINADFRRAAEFYKTADNFRGPVDDLMPILEDKSYLHDITPRSTIAWASFMHRTGMIKTAPANWKDLFFPEVHHLQGS
jgi:NitT/TauT family transport system substrate-binding protein